MSPLDDIPEAARDTPLGSSAPAPLSGRMRLSKTLKWISLVGLSACAALAAGVFAAWYQTQGATNLDIVQSFQRAIPQAGTTVVEAQQPEVIRDRALQLAPSAHTLLGHRAHEEAPEADLVPLAANASIRLRTAAAEQFEAMAQNAATAGITLVPLSGFRSEAEQEALFFQVKADRGQDVETRAEVSAPPGYSEHHTGYAIDLGDATQPGTHINADFANTAAYKWMEDNADRYDFELSFPPDNLQGVVFEPWHWRFVGNRDSLETFYQE